MSAINWVDGDGVFEDAPLLLMDRVRNMAGAYPTQASITSIKYKVFACEDEDAVIAANGEIVGTETTCVIADVLYDTLQTDSRWTKDTTGYNLAIELPPGSRPAGGWHRIEAVITPVTGSPYPVVWGVRTLAMAGS